MVFLVVVEPDTWVLYIFWRWCFEKKGYVLRPIKLLSVFFVGTCCGMCAWQEGYDDPMRWRGNKRMLF